MSNPQREAVNHLEETNRLLREQNELLRKQIAVHSNWRYIMGRSALTGLMTVIGATVLVSILLWAAKPFTGIERIGPLVERLTQALEEGRK